VAKDNNGMIFIGGVALLLIILFGQNFGLFSIGCDDQTKSGIWNNILYTAKTSNCFNPEDGTIDTSTDFGNPLFLRLSNSITIIKDRSEKSSSGEVLFDYNIRQFDTVDIKFDTVTHYGRCSGGSKLDFFVVDDSNNRFEITSKGDNPSGCDSGGLTFSDITIKISPDKKQIEAYGKTTSFENAEGKLRLLIRQTSASSGGFKGEGTSIETKIYSITGTGPITVINPPVIPSPTKVLFSPTSKYNSQIKSSIKEFLGVGIFSIFGPLSINPKDTVSYHADFQVPIDNNFQDKTFTYQYANWILTDNIGNVLTEGNWEEIPSGVYSKDFTININEEGTYVLASVIQQSILNYNDGWSVINETFYFDSGAKKLTVSSLTPPQTNETIQPPPATQNITITESPSFTTRTLNIQPLKLSEVPEKLPVSTNRYAVIIIGVLFLSALIYFSYRK